MIGRRFWRDDQPAGLHGLQRGARFAAIATPENHHVGCALSHRAIVDEARRLGLNNVLLFEDDVVLSEDALPALDAAMRELDGRDWDLLYLGGCRWEHRFAMAEGCNHLECAGPVTCAHAIAYNASIYDRILAEVPRELPAMVDWLALHHGIDQYYAFCIVERKYIVSPVIATQLAILGLETAAVRERFAACIA